MGIWETVTELVEAAAPWAVAEAEAPADNDKEEKKDDEEESEDKKDGDEGEGEEEDGGDEDEEEEEEDEPQDPKEKLEEECKESRACAPVKHHFDECVERVTNASENGGDTKEDCVEEFFHLAHCASACAAPKLWSVLK